jgi:hypothetical protein
MKRANSGLTWIHKPQVTDVLTELAAADGPWKRSTGSPP